MTTEAVPAPDLDAFKADDDFDGPNRIDPDGYERIELMATLKKAGASTAQNGDNYDVAFEIDVEGFCRLAIDKASGHGSYTATWDKLMVGNGALVRNLSMVTGAENDPTFKLTLHLPESEISRSLGRLAAMLGKRSRLVLEPEQGELGLHDGTKVDLTAKADD